MSHSLPITDTEAIDLARYFTGRFTIVEFGGYHWITDGGDVYIIDRQPNGRLMLDDPPGRVPAEVRESGRAVVAESKKPPIRT